MGTTGWDAQANAVRQIVVESGIGLLASSNFSIGVSLFLKIAERAGELFQKFDQYDVFTHEFHHRQKADSPSGTALMLGKILLKTIPRKTEILVDTSHGKIAPQALHMTSTRGGFVPGTHEVFFDSEADTIEIRHTARSRAGFATGALKAAERLHGKRGFFTMEDYLNKILIPDT
jgi:4-hydroxy-tetrahydrodipicolinate reductase